MTARFEAFKEALHALCIEHGVRLRGVSYDDPCPSVETAGDGVPAGLDMHISDDILPTPEELAERREMWAKYEAERAVERAEWEKRQRQRMEDPDGWYQQTTKAIEAHAAEQRKKQMRISTDPNDPAYIDARPRKVWVGERLIEGWTVADEFRRVVITPEKVHHGAVLIERLPASPGAEPAAAPPSPGAEAPRAPARPAVKHGKRR